MPALFHGSLLGLEHRLHALISKECNPIGLATKQGSHHGGRLENAAPGLSPACHRPRVRAELLSALRLAHRRLAPSGHVPRVRGRAPCERRTCGLAPGTLNTSPSRPNSPNGGVSPRSMARIVGRPIWAKISR